MYTVGGSIPADGQASTWASRAVEEPQVLRYTLVTLDDLLTKAYFPNDSKISEKRANLKLALDDYCKQLIVQGAVTSCESPLDPPVKLQEFGGMFQQDDCNRNNVVNGLTGGLNCAKGYTPAQILRIKAPESNCGAWQVLCYRSGQKPTSFGEQYTTCSD